MRYLAVVAAFLAGVMSSSGRPSPPRMSYTHPAARRRAASGRKRHLPSSPPRGGLTTDEREDIERFQSQDETGSMEAEETLTKVVRATELADAATREAFMAECAARDATLDGASFAAARARDASAATAAAGLRVAATARLLGADGVDKYLVDMFVSHMSFVEAGADAIRDPAERQRLVDTVNALADRVNAPDRFREPPADRTPEDLDMDQAAADDAQRPSPEPTASPVAEDRASDSVTEDPTDSDSAIFDACNDADPNLRMSFEGHEDLPTQQPTFPPGKYQPCAYEGAYEDFEDCNDGGAFSEHGYGSECCSYLSWNCDDDVDFDDVDFDGCDDDVGGYAPPTTPCVEMGTDEGPEESRAEPAPAGARTRSGGCWPPNVLRDNNVATCAPKKKRGLSGCVSAAEKPAFYANVRENIAADKHDWPGCAKKVNAARGEGAMKVTEQQCKDAWSNRPAAERLAGDRLYGKSELSAVFSKHYVPGQRLDFASCPDAVAHVQGVFHQCVLDGVLDNVTTETPADTFQADVSDCQLNRGFVDAQPVLTNYFGADDYCTCDSCKELWPVSNFAPTKPRARRELLESFRVLGDRDADEDELCDAAATVDLHVRKDCAECRAARRPNETYSEYQKALDDLAAKNWTGKPCSLKHHCGCDLVYSRKTSGLFQMHHRDPTTKTENVTKYGYWSQFENGLDLMTAEFHLTEPACYMGHPIESVNYLRDHWKDYVPSRRGAYNKFHRDAAREFVDLVKAKIGKCQTCGKEWTKATSAGYDFAHREDQEQFKVAGVSHLASGGGTFEWKLKRIVPEIKKCGMQDANCHRKDTLKRGGFGVRSPRSS
mmetsp:Transcript_4150/g.12913  ORF Transcript_4150/g.12913 Transcript_4150/m.12913 type:complete len:833 (+) Transcript_4150:156-2654(+)